MLINACPNLNVLIVESDSRISPGACWLSSDIGVVETDLETQIREIEYTLSRSIAGITTPPEMPRDTPAPTLDDTLPNKIRQSS
jgi:hypothetical protein